MKEALFYLRNDRVLKLALLSSSLFLLFQIIFLAATYAKLPPLIPLYLQRTWGMLQVATKVQIFLLPLLTISLMTVNTFLAASFYKESPLVARILLWGQALFGLLATLALLRIILLVI